MSSPVKQEVNGKRKKTREKRGSYLNKWLDKTVNNTPSSMEYDSYIQPVWNDPSRYLSGSFYPPEPMSLPTYPVYPNFFMNQPIWSPEYTSKSIQVHRPRIKRDIKKETTLKSDECNEYTSLPPIVTSLGDTTSNSDLNNEKDDSGNRRFSDPCLARPVENGCDKGSSVGTDTSDVGSQESKLIACLVDQINTLKLNNERLSKELNETRAELIGVRQQMSLWHRGSTSSLGTNNNNHTVNNNNNGVITSTSTYSPGMLSDLVREIREAARVRDEAIFVHVRTLIDERTRGQQQPQQTHNQDSISPEKRNYEDIKNELRASEADKRLLHERLTRMEEEMERLRIGNGIDNTYESETMRLKRELTEAKKSKKLSDERAHKLELLVTQLRSTKYNGIQQQHSPTSPTLYQHPNNIATSCDNTTTQLMFGPVTNL